MGSQSSLGKLLEEQRVGGQSHPMGTKLPLKNFLHTDRNGKSRSRFRLIEEGLNLELRESLSPIRRQEVTAPTDSHFPSYSRTRGKPSGRDV